MSTNQPKPNRKDTRSAKGTSETPSTKPRTRRARTTTQAATTARRTKETPGVSGSASGQGPKRTPRKKTTDVLLAEPKVKQAPVETVASTTTKTTAKTRAAKGSEVAVQSGAAKRVTAKPRISIKQIDVSVPTNPVEIVASEPVFADETTFSGASTLLGTPTVPISFTQPSQVTLPERAVKIKEIVARVQDVTTEVIQDKVIIQGIVHKQIFFVGTDMVVHHLAEDAAFSTFVDIPGATAGNNVFVRVEVEGVLFHLAPDGLTLDQKVVLQLFVKVTETVQVNAVSGNGPLVKVEEVIGENTCQTLVENVIGLASAAIKVSEIQASVRDLTAEVIPGKVIIQGAIHKQIFFVSLDGLERHQAEEVRFSTFVDVPGAAAGMNVQVHPQVETVIFELLSQTELLQKVVLAFFVKVTQTVQINVAEGTGPLFRLAQVVGENVCQSLVESTVQLERTAVKVREIVARIQDVTAKVILNKVIIQGILHKQIFFIGTDNIEYHQAENVPFSLFADVPGAVSGMDVQTDIIIEHIMFELLPGNQVIQKVVIQVFIKVTQELQFRMATGEGVLVKVEQVIGENVRQILIRRVIPIIVTPTVIPTVSPTVSPVVVGVVRILIPGVQAVVTQQALIENSVELPQQAIKIRAVTGTIENLEAQAVPGGLLVSGVVEKSVDFVDTADIVRNVQEEVPFSVLVSIPDIAPGEPLQVQAELENITFALANNGRTLNQAIVIRVTVTRMAGESRVVEVVTSVEFPGVETTQLLVRALVLRDTVPQLEEISVVTDARGPGVANITREVIPLDVVGDANPQPVPVEVVTSITLAPIL